MDSKTVFTKTAKGLMEATGKTSTLSRDMRKFLKEIDGKATVGDVQAKLGDVPEAKLQEALQVLTSSEFIREFAPKAPAKAPPPPLGPAAADVDLDFTGAIPTVSAIARIAEEAAREQAEARIKAAEAEAAAKAKAEAEARARTAAAEAAARAKAAVAQAAARATAEAEAKARGEAEALAKAEAEVRAKRDAEVQARHKVEKKARQEAEQRAKAQEQARIEAEARARKEAEERARIEAELNARLEEERKARGEAERKAKAEAERERKEAEEKSRREADELRAKLEEERRAREEAERKAKAEAERERKEAEEKARREADELRAKLEEERRAREEAERKAKAEAERERKEAEEKARREADELRAKLEEERRAREEAEREAKVEAERRAREDAEREAREQAERKAKEEAEREAKEQAERVAREAEERARKAAEDRAKAEAERKDRERAEREAKEHAEREAHERAERVARETEERTRKEAEVQAAREAEDRAREEAEVRLRREAEERSHRVAQQEREAEEKARKDAEATARREAEEQARPQAQASSGASLDDLVRIETDFDAVLGANGSATKEAANVSAGADNKKQQEAVARALREAEERTRDEAQERARNAAEAEAKRVEDERRRKREEGREQKQTHPAEHTLGDVAAGEREYAELKALLDAQKEETERHFAEMEKEMEAEEAAAREQIPPPKSRADTSKRSEHGARGRIRAEVAMRAEVAKAASEEFAPTYRMPVNWGKPLALGLFLILVIGLGLIHVVSFDGYIPQLERLASAYLRQPVKINALHLSMVPTPHLRLEGVSAGSEGQFAAERIKAFAELGSMFSETKAFTSIELISPVLSEEGLFALLFGKPQGQDFKVASISAKNGKLDSKTIILPTLDARISMGEDGVWQKIALETPDRKTSLQLEPAGEGAQLEVETNVFSTPFGPAFLLENFSAKGMMNRDQLRLSEFKGGIFGGYLSGSLNLKWGAGWSLSGEISARAIDPGRIAPALIEEGTLEGKAEYAMRAKSYDELFTAPRLEGSFAVRKGSLLGVDLARLLQGGGIGGKTVFSELSGNFVRDGDRTQLQQLRLSAGPLLASGSADADARKNIGGRFAVELKSPVAQARANLALTGTLREPRFNR